MLSEASQLSICHLLPPTRTILREKEPKKPYHPYDFFLDVLKNKCYTQRRLLAHHAVKRLQPQGKSEGFKWFHTHMPGICSSLDKSRIKTVTVVSLSSRNLNLAGSALHKYSSPVTGLLANQEVVIHTTKERPKRDNKDICERVEEGRHKN